MSRALAFAVLALTAVMTTALAPRASAQGLTPIQTMKLRTVTSVSVHPSGKQLMFTRTEPRLADEAPGPNYNHLFLMDTDGESGSERRLIGGKKSARGAAFSPDGKWITLVDRRDGDKHSEIYALSLSGGEAQRLFTTARGIGSYKWHPKGDGIAYSMRDARSAADRQARKLGFRPRIMDESWVHTSLWYWDKKTNQSRRLTSGRTVNSFEWSADGSKLACGLAPRPIVNDRYMFTRLFAVDLITAKTTPIVDNPGKLGEYQWSPGGDHLAYVSGADKRDPHAGMLYVVGKDGKPRALTDGFRGMVHQVKWFNDETIGVVVSVGVSNRLATIDVATATMTYWGDDPGVAFTHLDGPDGGPVFTAASTSRHPAEVFKVEHDGAFARKTNSNPWLADVTLGEQTVEKYKARDGLEIEGLLIHPVNAEKGKRHPLVILAHGGPESHFSNGWLTAYSRWGQILAGRGYYVWCPNYRASTGYGVEFAKADHGDPMGGEFNDHIDAVAHFAEQGLVDEKRVGIGGGSYGGYTAAWAATRHSKHFACAVSFVPFVDIRTKWYTSDIPDEFYLVHYEEKWPHEQEPFLRERSPLTYARFCKTPLLLLGGDADPRVHPSQPFMLYRAVKTATRTPCRYVQYPGEGHGNRVNVNRYDYLIRTLRWFEHYLKEGDHRMDAPPEYALDLSEWEKTAK